MRKDLAFTKSPLFDVRVDYSDSGDTIMTEVRVGSGVTNQIIGSEFG